MRCYNCGDLNANPCNYDLTTNDLRCQTCFDAINDNRARRNMPLILWITRPTKQGDTDNELESDDDE